MTGPAGIQRLIVLAYRLIDGIQFVGIRLQLRNKISRNIVLCLHIVADDPFA